MAIFFTEILIICLAFDHASSNFLFMIYFLKGTFIIMTLIWLFFSIMVGFMGMRWNGMEERRETFVNDNNEVWDANVKKVYINRNK